ncbi:MAG: MarR family EPS-associated transcriptional regulator [Betaproteobacteria bacterium]
MTPKEAAHFRVLSILEKSPDITQRELSAQLGLSLSKTNYLLNSLIDKGAVKIENFRRSDTKLKKIAYILTPSGISERIAMTTRYLERKRAEYDALRAEIEAIEREAGKASRSEPMHTHLG